MLKKTSGLLFGFVVGGKSEGAFAMWEAEVRGKGVVRTGQRRKKKPKTKTQPFVAFVSYNYF